MSTSDRSVTFTGPVIDALQGIVQSWISEGFTTPPYTSEVYDIIEALGITRNEVYDVRRPGAGSESSRGER